MGRLHDDDGRHDRHVVRPDHVTHGATARQHLLDQHGCVPQPERLTDSVAERLGEGETGKSLDHVSGEHESRIAVRPHLPRPVDEIDLPERVDVSLHCVIATTESLEVVPLDAARVGQ